MSEVTACPECAQGKCVNCTGWAIDEITDEVVECRCPAPVHPFNQEAL